jgi:hypothetical protein
MAVPPQMPCASARPIRGMARKLNVVAPPSNTPDRAATGSTSKEAVSAWPHASGTTSSPKSADERKTPTPSSALKMKGCCWGTNLLIAANEPLKTAESTAVP